MIVSSTYQMDTNSQVDGRYYVKELHTDGEGNVYIIGPYLVPSGFDMDARLAIQALVLEEALAEAEVSQIIE